MPQEPADKRTVAFFDGQNLFQCIDPWDYRPRHESGSGKS